MGRAVLLSLVAVSSIAAAGQPWLKATSQNFEVYTAAGEPKAREVILYFEQVRSFFETAVRVPGSAKGRVRIVAFASPAEYAPYQLNATSPAYSGGDATRDVIVMGSVSPDDYPAAIHEYVHVLLKPVKNVPLWLNEGLAELYSSLRPQGSQVLVGSLIPGRVRVLQTGDWMDLDTLCSVDLDSPYYTKDHSRQQVFYAESWALAHMLVLGEPYRAKFPEFLELVTAAARPAGPAFEKAFGKPAREVLADLRQYILGEKFTGLLFDAPPAVSAQNSVIHETTPLESGMVLASLLADIHRTDEARQTYRRLAGENPTSPLVPEALGYLEWRAGRPSQAVAEFARAVELESTNPKMYYDYSGLMGDSEAVRSRRVTLLRTAVALDPHYDEARYHLGLLLVAQGNYENALAQFAAVTGVRPEEYFEFHRAVAYAAYQTGDEDKARANLKRAAGVARDPVQRGSLAQLAAALGESLESAREAPKPAAPPPREPALKIEANAATQAIEQRLTKTVEGTLDQIECLPQATRLRMTVDGRTMRFLTDQKQALEIRGRKGRPFSLVCGPQKTRPLISVEYDPTPNEKLGAAGVVRAIELK